MKLFHFCSSVHLPAILKAGLMNGYIPMSMEPVRLKDGYQWLTSNPDFDQAWSRDSSLPYDRTAHRLTIEIPDRHKRKVLSFLTDLKKMIPKEMFETLSYTDFPPGYADPENWFVFKGMIPFNWIKKVDNKVADGIE